MADLGRAPGGATAAGDRWSSLWPNSPSYAAVKSEGHSRPPPSFGAPTLIWHFGIWPSRTPDDADFAREANFTEAETFYHRREEELGKFDDQNIAFFTEVNHFVMSLQERGRTLGNPLKVLEFPEAKIKTSAEEDRKHYKTKAFRVCDPQALAFTLWWQDDATDGRRNERQDQAAQGDLRVRVQAQTHLDHATISFFIDVGRPSSGEQFFDSKEAVGRRRRQIFEQLERVREICDRQIRDGFVDFDVVPELGISPDENEALSLAADYCYRGIWQEFTESFEIRLPDRARPPDSIGNIFANFRGLVLSVDGIDTPENKARAARRNSMREELGISREPQNIRKASQSVGIGEFETFDNGAGEPNTVLKAYWPLIRRITPSSDERDFVACGINDWRALYVTALGSHDISGKSDRDAEDAPIRYLFLTKREPHRQQIGRFVERINAIGTMRLFALQNWAVIRNANSYIRILGRELDGILYRWSAARMDIDNDYYQRLGELRKKRNFYGFERDSAPARRGWRLRPRPNVEPEDIRQLRERRLARLNELISYTEWNLITLGASLDEVGQGGSGRLLYAINRAKYFIDEFYRMAATLKVGNIDTWTSYSQFVDRGLRPTFDFIAMIGARFVSLRDRLQMVTEMIQTSALIVEADATSRNTGQLEKIASHWYWVNYGLWGLNIGLWGLIASILADVFRSHVESFFSRVLPQILHGVSHLIH